VTSAILCKFEEEHIHREEKVDHVISILVEHRKKHIQIIQNSYNQAELSIHEAKFHLCFVLGKHHDYEQ